MTLITSGLNLGSDHSHKKNLHCDVLVILSSNEKLRNREEVAHFVASEPFLDLRKLAQDAMNKPSNDLHPYDGLTFGGRNFPPTLKRLLLFTLISLSHYCLGSEVTLNHQI